MAQNILDKILETKHKEVAKLHKECNFDDLLAAAQTAPPTRGFLAAMSKPPKRAVNLIAEIKKASPSKGLIRQDFDPPGLAKSYAAAGADALSVLTDEQYFQGSLDFLRQVRAAVDLPIIRKDFIIDPWQIYEARAAGADAILLIAAALEPDKLVELMTLAGQLDLCVLLEIHNRDEYEKVITAKNFPPKCDWLLGINNRDLTTFDVDLNTTIQLLRQVEALEKIPVVSESGIQTHDDVKRLAAAGVSAILVGETFMRCENVADGVAAMLDGE
ncbi:MAG: indole-3-glycerol phosphate synthase TrpC [Phycisphaerae bacterium]|nr:indole-3-glycerol phosphate synthase TrpC [Phycisphaerae bacterium]